MKKRGFFLALIAGALTASIVLADGPVPNLQDLVGARGRDGETQLQQRGYRFVRTEKSDDSAYGYWREGGSNKCVCVRTTQGRYASIVYAMDFDCRTGAGEKNPNQDRKGAEQFNSVCTVEVNGKTYRYRCKIEEYLQDGHRVRTVLHYPDITLELLWHDQGKVTVRTQGLTDRQARFTRNGDKIKISAGQKNYEYISTPERAGRAYEDLHN